MENINLQWFFKLPGLFITGGVILILVALIVYIIGSIKEKKMAKASNDYGVDTSNAQDTPVENVAVPLVNPSFVVENKDSSNNIGGEPVTIANQQEKIETTVNGPTSFEPTIAPVEPITPAVNVENVVKTEPEVEVKNDSVETPIVAPIITPIEPVSATPIAPSQENSNVVTPIVPGVQPVVQDKLADEVKTVEVNVTPAPEINVSIPEVKIEPENTASAPSANTNINEPIVIAPVVDVKPQTQEVKEEQPIAAVEITPGVVTDDNIEEI